MLKSVIFIFPVELSFLNFTCIYPTAMFPHFQNVQRSSCELLYTSVLNVQDKSLDFYLPCKLALYILFPFSIISTFSFQLLIRVSLGTFLSSLFHPFPTENPAMNPFRVYQNITTSHYFCYMHLGQCKILMSLFYPVCQSHIIGQRNVTNQSHRTSCLMSHGCCSQILNNFIF